MTTEIATVRAPAQPHTVFYLAMGTACAVIAFGGFARTYLLPVVMNRFDGPAILHLHGMLFLGWTVLLASQSRLVRRRRIEAHRAWGMAGISLATAMVFTAVMLVVRGLDFSVTAGTLAVTRRTAIAPLSQVALFAGFVTAAIATVRRPETHRRLMVLATANLLPPAVARLFGAVLGPLSRAPVDGGRPNFALVTDESLAFSVTLVAALVVDLLVAVAIVRDWRTRRRPHPAYVIGGACMLLVQLLRQPFAQTRLWHWATDALLALGR